MSKQHRISGYSCSSDDEFRFRVGMTSTDLSVVFTSGSATFTFGQHSDGSCPVTPDSMTSGPGIFDSDLGFCADSDILSHEVDRHLGFGCSYGDDDVNWFRSSSLMDDLGLDLDLDGPEIGAAHSILQDPSCASPGVMASVETGSDVNATGNDSHRSLFPIISSRFITGDEISDSGCQQRPISIATSASDEAVAKRRSQLPSNRCYHSNTLLDGTTHQSNKRTNYQCSDDVIDDVTVIPTSGIDVTDRCHVLADHRYSNSPLTCVPPNKIFRISPDPVQTKASILATLLLTKKPLRANAGSDALLAQDGPRGSQPRRHPSLVTAHCVLEDPTEIRKKEASTADVVQTPNSVCRTEKTSCSSFSRSFEDFELDGDCLVGDGNELQWTESQMASFQVEDKLFTQKVEPNDLWMHLNDLL